MQVPYSWIKELADIPWAAEELADRLTLSGAEAEVDFADLWIILDGVKTKVFLFTLRLSHSGRAVHRVVTPVVLARETLRHRLPCSRNRLRV